MANEYQSLAVIQDTWGDREIRVDVVHLEEGGYGYRLQVLTTGGQHITEVQTEKVA